MLIGLMSLPNPVVYIQFHPVAYMVKLNIEMSMAKLITRLARRQETDMTDSIHRTPQRSGPDSHAAGSAWNRSNAVELTKRSRTAARHSDLESGDSQEDFDEDAGIRKKTEIVVEVEASRQDTNPSNGPSQHVDDEVPLTSNAGHPKGYNYGGEDKRVAFSANRQ
jgi:hypothetical protein